MVEERDFIFYVFFFVMTAGEVYKKTKPATTKKAKKSKLWTKYKGFIRSKTTEYKDVIAYKTESQAHTKTNH